jgi:hypothetical protein
MDELACVCQKRAEGSRIASAAYLAAARSPSALHPALIATRAEPSSFWVSWIGRKRKWP